MMINKFKILLLLLPIVLLVGCSKDFLEGPEAQDDPNRAVEVTADQLFNGIQVKTFFQQEGAVSRTLSIWMQSLGGTDRQTGALGEYVYYEEDLADEMEEFYVQGGLIDIKELVRQADAAGNRVYAGIARFYEAYNMGTASSLWGDLPYSEACTDVETPKLDDMAEIYTALQALLDDAISDLQSGERGVLLAYNPVNDVIYDSDPVKWIQACYSLKARLYMHWAKVNAGNYNLALNAARMGIAAYADNFHSVHSSELNEEFLYNVYQNQRDTYIRAGQFIIDLLKTKNDPRLPLYFDPDANGEFSGAPPGERNMDASMLSASEYLRANKSFDLLTWEETQLIIAECAFKTGDEGTALAKLNEVRRGIEQRWGFAADALGVASGLSGDALFDEIMQEKYITLFLNIEVYNDWKRTNRPLLVPYGGGDPATAIPRRLYYSDDERNTNSNIPNTSAQPRRNANDPS